jgi:hypothetical protein
MSTLCRAERGWQKYGGAETSERPFFCPTHLSTFQKCRVKEGRNISDFSKDFGNISDKQPFSEIISDLFFLETGVPGQAQSNWACRADLSRQSRFGGGGSRWGKGGSNSVKPALSARPAGKSMQLFYNEQLTSKTQSNPVKLSQTGSNRFETSFRRRGRVSLFIPGAVLPGWAARISPL